MDALRHDLRFALRTFLRNAGCSAVIPPTLALGIGATTAIFSVVNGASYVPARRALGVDPMNVLRNG